MPVYYNKLILWGHLTASPILRQDGRQNSYCVGQIKVDRTWQDDDKQSHTESCVVDYIGFGPLAQGMSKCLAGQFVMLEGRIGVAKFRDEDKDRTNLRMIVNLFLADREHACFPRQGY